MDTNVARGVSRLRNEDGFSLIEALAASVIAAIILIGLTVTVMSSFRSVKQSRSQQQATAIATEGVEFAQSVAWVELATFPAHPPAPVDPLVLAGTPRTFNGPPLGLPAGETLQEKLGGMHANAAVSRLVTETWDGVTFDARTYITEVETDLRRVIVLVEWQVGGTEYEEWTTTLISQGLTP